MKSQTSLAARNCRLQEWSKMVHSCNNRPIGMSVDEWCRENSITTANYYYRMTQVRKACLDSLSSPACQTPAKKYKLYKKSINKSLYFAQISLSSSPRRQRVTAQLSLSRK